MGTLELLNLNSKTWESPNSVGWFFDFVATSSGSSFPKFSKKRSRNHRKNPWFLGVFFQRILKITFFSPGLLKNLKEPLGFLQ
jgi:hypothetical protein